jgi:hypothetical protein
MKFLITYISLVGCFISCKTEGSDKLNQGKAVNTTTHDSGSEFLEIYKNGDSTVIALKSEERYDSLNDFIKKEYEKSPHQFVYRFTRLFNKAASEMVEIDSCSDLVLKIESGRPVIDIGVEGSGYCPKQKFDNYNLVKDPRAFNIGSHEVKNHTNRDARYMVVYSGANLLVVPTSEDKRNANAVAFNIELAEEARRDYYKYAIEFIYRNMSQLNLKELGHHVAIQNQHVIHFRIPFRESEGAKHIAIAKSEHAICTKCNKDVNTSRCS